MYLKKCSKCGAEFETKNPKRVICPACLYPDRKPILFNQSKPSGNNQQDIPKENSYNQKNNSYNQNRSNYNRSSNNSYGRNNYNQNRPSNNRNFRNNNNNDFRRNNNRNNQNFGNNRKKATKQLLVSKEQLAEIEKLYKPMLPLPNPDCHEVIGEKINLEGKKVFFGINLIRQKMKLPKLPFPKRKLAVSPDQLEAIKSLYDPLLPVPPIGCHKIISKQLKIDEWRVHVGIGLIRKQMNLPRWNTEREDIPKEFKNKEQIKE